MKKPTWLYIGTETPCPICGSVGGRPPCRFTRTQKAVYCTHPDVVADPGAVPAAWQMIRPRYEGEHGVLFSALTPEGGMYITKISAPTDRTDKIEEIERWKRGTALSLADRARPSVRVEEYLRARGIPIERLPGGVVPAALKFLEHCPSRNGGREDPCGPAMVARIMEIKDVDGKPHAETAAIHRTFLDPGGAPRKREPDEIIEDVKKTLGQVKGRGIYLGGPQDYRGVLFIAEGIETTLSGMAAIGCPGYVGVSADGVESLSVPLSLVKPVAGAPEGARFKVHTIIIGADCNKAGAARDVEQAAANLHKQWGHEGITLALAKWLVTLPTGLRAATTAMHRLVACYPWLTVRVKSIKAELLPELVKVAESGTYKGVHVPIAAKGGVDWNDALNAVGLEKVREALLEGVDLAANEAAAAQWWEKGIPAESMRPVWDADVEAREDAEDGRGSSGGGDGGRGKPPTPAPGGSGGNGPADGNGRVKVRLQGGPRDGEWRVLLPSEDLELARMFLEDVYGPPGLVGAQRAGRGLFIIARPGVKGELDPAVFDGVRWERVSTALVVKRVREWLTAGAREVFKKDGRELMPYDPSDTKVRSVARSALEQVMVMTGRMRFWMRPLFDETGKAVWSRPEGAIAVETGAEIGRPEADQVLSFRNCQLSELDLVRGDCKPWVNTELLYNETVFPYELPIEEFRDCLEGGSFDAFTKRHAPIFRDWWDNKIALDREEKTLGQQWAGYGMRWSVAMKRNNLLMLVGPKDSGKGTFAVVVELVVGEQNMATSTLREMVQPFHIASWRHKLLVYVDEVEAAGYKENAAAMELIKSITGDGKQNVRDLYEKANANEKLGVRFLISCNEPPDLVDSSGAWLSRVLVLNFRQSNTGNMDPGIKEGIRKEGLGIVVWGIEGMIEGYGKLFNQPARSASVMGVMKAVSNPMDEFIDEWLEILPPTARNIDGSMPHVATEALHEAWCVMRDEGKPEVKMRGRFVKRLLTPLQSRGWQGEYRQPRDKVTLPDGTIETVRVAGYTQLRLSQMAVNAIVDYRRAAAGVIPYSNDHLQPGLPRD